MKGKLLKSLKGTGKRHRKNPKGHRKFHTHISKRQLNQHLLHNLQIQK